MAYKGDEQNKWQSDWKDFLFEDEVSTGLGSSGNVKRWFVQKWNSLKEHTKKKVEKAITDFLEIDASGHLFTQYATGQKLGPEEEALLEQKATDILENLGLVGVIALPGGKVALNFLVEAAKNLDINLSVYSSLGEDAEGDDWPLSSKGAEITWGVGAMVGLIPENVSSADSLSKTITSDIINWLKTDFYDLEDPDSAYFKEEYYLKSANKELEVEFTVDAGKTGTGKPFSIDTGVYSVEEDPYLEITMTFDDRHPITRSLEDIYFKLLEDIRHELEHVISELPGGKPDLSRGDYYIDQGEVPSMVRGLHLRAKKMKIPTTEMFQRELEPYLKNGEIDQQEYDTILNTWTKELDKIQGKIK